MQYIMENQCGKRKKLEDNSIDDQGRKECNLSTQSCAGNTVLTGRGIVLSSKVNAYIKEQVC